MKATTAATTFVSLIGLAAADAELSSLARRGSSILKRWDYDVCSNDCSLAGVAMPDKDNFQLPLENNWSEQCPKIIIGPYDAPLATSRVCLDFIGPNIYFNVSSFPGYTTKSATVTWKLMGNMIDSAHWSTPPPTATLTCAPSGVNDQLVCKLPFNDALGLTPTTSIKSALAGMCPNGDREGLGFYLQFSGQVESVDSATNIKTVHTFVHEPVCTQRDSRRSCTAWNPTYNYFAISYRCSKCNVAPCPAPSSTSSTETPTAPTPPPSLKTCAFGTAFGFQNPVAGVEKSTTLNSQSGQGCNRWGWYETPTLAELQGGISGPLYVGAGGNDITKAIDVGVWVATANPTGRVTVTYLLNPPYVLAEVHVDLDCLPIDKCGPGQYTYNAGSIPNLPTWSNPTPLVYPTCSGGSRAYLIVHAAVNILTVTNTCPAPKAS
ncbi:uncharacterized protein CTRU02_201465 [Colletotrichum truncatum]|uniref:Uncharacterized protein n=1 Tax=Colletotrichum truncatum TaxID=5467 RepID=A0ACC3ZI07_COLTU|nr:uncharacterized protein CTRU02_14336 [Colletotrichum truncatum]KAF6782297.1 hypothetical protein CTRU02_14336 [Colletotrichum truncatum]